jgi:hypothetical protein
MAISVANLTIGRLPTNQNAYVTPVSLSPAAGRIVYAHVVSDRDVSGTTNEPTLTGGGVDTWTSTHTEVNAQSTRRSTWFRALTGATPTSGAVTIDFGGQTQQYAMWSFEEVDGALLTGTNGADSYRQGEATGSGASGQAVLVTLPGAWGAADNRALCAVSHLSATITLTPGTGFEQVATVSGSGTPTSTLLTLFGRDGDTLDVDGTLTMNAAWLAHAIEIVAGGAPTPPTSGGSGGGAVWFG